jgi:hypothetical protein
LAVGGSVVLAGGVVVGWAAVPEDELVRSLARVAV